MDRQEEIREKGFYFGNIKVGKKEITDAILTLSAASQKVNRQLNNKQYILNALAKNDAEALRSISNHYYRTDGIYSRVCNYYAGLYRYDWHIVPESHDENLSNEKIVAEFSRVLTYLDNSDIKLMCNNIARKAIVEGVYYGYVVEGSKRLFVQDLPAKYCRSRYSVAGRPAVEFNMRFFDESFPDAEYRIKVLKLFPKDFQEGYFKYKAGKLQNDDSKNSAWYLLNPDAAIKFAANDDELPMFVDSVPAIIDLNLAQDLDRRKQLQKLLKIVVQKLPMDKNGDLIFDVDEAKDIHANAVEMLSNAVGVDVLTTFADVDSIDTSDRNSSTSVDDLEKVERTVYNSIGASRNLFNAEGNLALNNSVLTDEAFMKPFLLQLQSIFNFFTQRAVKKKKVDIRFYMLETTQFNYKELSKMYKEQTQLGFSKMLPQVALGHNQSSILAAAVFENQILKLSEIMIPPLMSSTMNGEALLGKNGQQNNSKKQDNIEEKQTGRPEKDDSQKSEKTIQNKESMS